MLGYLGRMDLITGATGIVGVHLLMECTAHGPVRAIHRAGSDRSIVERVFAHYGINTPQRIGRIEWVEADLLDTDALNRAMQGIRRVYHAAAIVSFNPKDALQMDRINAGGTANVVNAALASGVVRLCHVSSTATIGQAPQGVMRDEETPWNEDRSTSAYAMSKYAAEMEVQRGIAEGLDAVIVNPCIVIGPGVAGRSSMTLVERMRKGVRYVPPGSNAVVDARDVAQCMLTLMEQGRSGERYLLVGENLSYATLFTQFAEAFGNATPRIMLRPWMLSLGWRIEWIRARLFGTTPFITQATAHSALIQRSYSAAKATRLLGYRFRSSAEAVENVVAFLRGAAAQ